MTLRLQAKWVRYHSELSENLPRKFDSLWETPQRFQMSLTSWDIAALLLLRAVKIHPESFIKVFLRLSIFPQYYLSIRLLISIQFPSLIYNLIGSLFSLRSSPLIMLKHIMFPYINDVPSDIGTPLKKSSTSFGRPTPLKSNASALESSSSSKKRPPGSSGKEVPKRLFAAHKGVPPLKPSRRPGLFASTPMEKQQVAQGKPSIHESSNFI